MSEGTRKKLCGATAGSGIASASFRDGIGAARSSGDVNTGILDEHVLTLVFRCINFDPKALCTVARVSRRLRAVAERVLWRELCVSRAPRMVASLLASSVPYFVCVSGHLHGNCWLARLTSSEGEHDDGAESEDDDDHASTGGGSEDGRVAL
ncbi:hypothetical protein PR202_ga09335 [Eleusine coracana subsp. coracana]|uniref:F-box domain-containing protein n=1 Tax=Eleusine coracana subsp. coracana TaxID=191504 RepID=A0AAV5C3I1_ELECO|nr:hypothetical protein PR202_ga09335 [Eleusine coracana subsp. coracana]